MKSSATKQLIVIGGPTGVGKSALAMRLALKLHCEIINADSRQIYRELEIGVNKPTALDLATVTHHLIGHVSVHEEYSVGKFETEALNVIEQLFSKYNIAIMVGGSGLYINAVLDGLDSFPNIPVEIRTNIREILRVQGLEKIKSMVENLDPEYYAVVDQKNSRRLTRALEVIMTTGQKYSVLRQAQFKTREFEILKFFVDDDRKVVYHKIDQRVEDMMAQGLKEEAQRLYPFRHLKSLETVGYREWFDCFDGKYDEAMAIDKIKQHTRNYAKRQWTWWKPLGWPTIHVNELDAFIEDLNLK